MFESMPIQWLPKDGLAATPAATLAWRSQVRACTGLERANVGQDVQSFAFGISKCLLDKYGRR
jgi:hypothetical protein